MRIDLCMLCMWLALAGSQEGVFAVDGSYEASAANNVGVKALSAHDVRRAISYFKKALVLDKNNMFARGNLAIAYNNYAATLPPARRINFLRKVMELDPDDQSAPVKLKATMEILEKQHAQPTSTADDLDLLDVHVPALKPMNETERRVFTPEVDFAPYMRDLNLAIKKQWFPQKGDENRRVIVTFCIAHNGEISYLKLKSSCGLASIDRAALDAVRMAAPFAQLPKGAPEKIDVQFTFPDNVFGVHSHSKAAGNLPVELTTPVMKWITGAREARANKQYDRAITLLDKALGSDPENGDANELFAQCVAEKTAITKDANATEMSLLYRAVHWNPYSGTIANRINECLKQRGINPSSFDDRLKYARSLKTKGELQPALYEYDQVLKIKDDQAVRTERAEISTAAEGGDLTDRWAKAFQTGGDAETHTDLGKAYELAGEDDKAEAEYKRALELDPHCLVAKSFLSSLAARRHPAGQASNKAAEP